jgi:signal transduction histidine kinase
MNIKVKMTLWYLLVVFSTVVFFGAVAYTLLVYGLSRNTVDPWDMRMAEIATDQDGGKLVTGFTSISGDMGASGDYTIVEIPGSKLLESIPEDGYIAIRALGSKPILVDKELLLGSNPAPSKQTWIYLFVSKTNPNDAKLIVAAQSDRNLASVLGIFARTVLITTAVTLLVAGLLGFVLVKRMLRPLQSIIGATREIDGKNVRRRLDVDRKDELGELASALNEMFGRIGNVLDAERQVASDLSHELRTPLAIAQAEASLMLTKDRSNAEYQKALETVSREISHLSSVTDRLLFLARSENGIEIKTDTVDIRELLTEIASEIEVICEAKNLGFQSELATAPGDCCITGDSVGLREMFLNLMDNAIKYTPSGGQICLELDRQDGRAVAAVRDTGIGIAEEHIPNLFKRFYRINQSGSDMQSGSGLGLAISQRIAQLHGGKIEVRSIEGVGTTFTVILPLTKTQEERPGSSHPTIRKIETKTQSA